MQTAPDPIVTESFTSFFRGCLPLIHPQLRSDIQSAIQAGDGGLLGRLIADLGDNVQAVALCAPLAQAAKDGRLRWQDWHKLDVVFGAPVSPKTPAFGGAESHEQHRNVIAFLSRPDVLALSDDARETLQAMITAGDAGPWQFAPAQIKQVVLEQDVDCELIAIYHPGVTIDVTFIGVI